MHFFVSHPPFSHKYPTLSCSNLSILRKLKKPTFTFPWRKKKNSSVVEQTDIMDDVDVEPYMLDAYDLN